MFTLKQVMVSNALSCVVFGAIFIVSPISVSSFLSLDNPAPEYVLMLIGGGLVLHGTHIFIISRKPTPHFSWILYFSMGDFLWVIASLLLILTDNWITSSTGIIAALVVAAMVGTFGILQIQKRQTAGS